ncbi:hypothetical protein AQJ66_32685 [Streptomyces bungoensis]|uniref:Uncharacterized protein n=1 Tax=Streptomyces bungoensis TaxID=285568 RepID=A0A101SPP3_9ACTN|nr:hypothetical protein [Streptomyces bungoensis]KUN77736.1 hypothetical protein AQJ66_32685 [Streptomyces bungoensis]
MGHGTLFVLFDKYSRRARLRPVLITLLPLALPAVVGVPALPRGRWLWSLILLSGLPLFADQLGRSRGKRIEARLYCSWGGKPTVQLLRWRGPTDRQRLRLLHARIQEIIGSSLPLPTEQEELADPQRADQIYDAAGLALRVRARGLPGADLVQEQNCEYGFRRNTLGLRPYALPIAVVGLLAVSAWAFAPPGFTGRPSTPLLVVLLVAEALLVAFQALLVREGWVASAAWLYAERLVETSALAVPGSLPADPATGPASS